MPTNNEIIPGFDDERDKNITISLRTTEDVPHGIIVYLSGYIDTYNSTYFQRKIEKIINNDYVNLMFNCAKLTYVSSTGIGSFAAFLKLAKSKGGDIVLLEVAPKVYEVFQLLGFSQFFNIKSTFEEGVDYFKQDLHAGIFPKVFPCPVCEKRLKAQGPGRFRCSECKSILAIDEQGYVLIG